MGVLPGDRHLIPAHALDAFDDADHRAGILKNRPLLDMQFEHRLELARAGLLLALVADADQLIAELHAIAVLPAPSAKSGVKTPA